MATLDNPGPEGTSEKKQEGEDDEHMLVAGWTLNPKP